MHQHAFGDFQLQPFGGQTCLLQDALDAGDDTGDSANDFQTALPRPINNARQIGTIPPSTCGNLAIEGVEQCDDGDLDNGDGCSSTCTIEPPQIFANGFE